MIPDADSELVIVTINEKEYETHLYNGTRRFVPNEAVKYITEAAGYATNSLRLECLEGRIPFADYLEFETMIGWSLGGFEDSILSMIDLNPHVFPGEREDHFRFIVPGW